MKGVETGTCGVAVCAHCDLLSCSSADLCINSSEMAYRYAQEVAPLLSSGICRSRSFGTSHRSLAAFAQAFAEGRPVWQVCEPRVEQLYRRSGRRPAFVYPLGLDRSGVSRAGKCCGMSRMSTSVDTRFMTLQPTCTWISVLGLAGGYCRHTAG